MLSKNDFAVLRVLNENPELSQRMISKKVNLSLGSVNKIVKNLRDKNILQDNKLTSQGRTLLNSFKVDNAIIMAAGMSSRFVPLSFEKPKGLLKVKGEILIERQITQLLDAGISDITIVVGYMKEQFFYLEEKYGVKIIVNEDYYKYNNTSTLIRVTDKLKNTYICSSDNYFPHNVFNEYEYNGYYSSVYCSGDCDEWCIKANKAGVITNVSTTGHDSWTMLGHVYFDRDFSTRFAEILKREYVYDATRHMLWEQVYANNIKQLTLRIKKFDDKDILEFDSLDELREFDRSYLNNANSKILQNICRVFDCKESEITDISTLKQNPSAITFKFNCRGEEYIYRHPDSNSATYSNYGNEAHSMQIAKRLGLNDSLIYIDSDDYWKISHYKEDSRPLDYHSEDDVTRALKLISRLHHSGETGLNDCDMWESTTNLTDKLQRTGRLEFTGFTELHEDLLKLNAYVAKDNYPKTICNCNFYDGNILIDNDDSIRISDWKYAGNDDPYNDMGTFICCSDYDEAAALKTLELYRGAPLSFEEKRHAYACIALSSYHWYIWAIYQDYCGTPMGKDIFKWFKYALDYSAKSLAMYENNRERN